MKPYVSYEALDGAVQVIACSVCMDCPTELWVDGRKTKVFKTGERSVQDAERLASEIVIKRVHC